MVCEQENRSRSCDRPGLTVLLFTSPKTEPVLSLPLYVCCVSTSSVYILSIPPFCVCFVFFLPSFILSCVLCKLLPHLCLAPCWCVLISGGCGGSSQSCKWGSPPGWPRHSVVQVRKPATFPTTIKTVVGEMGAVYQLGLTQVGHTNSREKKEPVNVERNYSFFFHIFT